MSESVRVRRWGRNVSLSVPVEFKDLFKDTDRAIVEQKGNALIYRPAEIRAKGAKDEVLGSELGGNI
mgnify:CR=1 FL=1